MRRRLLSAGTIASILLAAGTAQADPNDLALNRLSAFDQTPTGPTRNYAFQGGCGTAVSMYSQCEPDNQMFVNLVNELGGAFAPPLLTPAGTMGYNGVYFGYEQTITGINTNSPYQYWQRGTEGRPPPNGSNLMPPGGVATQQTRNSVPNQLFVSHFHVRKAFPFGFELGMHASYLHDSTMVALGLDIRWALFEGFRHGVGFLPNFSVRGTVNTLVGNPQLYLTVVGVDALISYDIPVAGVLTVQPYIGGQGLFIFGDSTVIDATPTRSSYAECTRRHVHYFTDSMGQPQSELICDSSVPGQEMPGMGPNDSRNEMVFFATRIFRARAILGLRFRVGMLTIAGEFADDVLDPRFLNNSDDVNSGGRFDNTTQMRTPLTIEAHPIFNANSTQSSQWQVSWSVGMQF